MANAFTTDVTKWQGVDDKPTAGSENLVESGGVADIIGVGKDFGSSTPVTVPFEFEVGKSYYIRDNRPVSSSYTPINVRETESGTNVLVTNLGAGKIYKYTPETAYHYVRVVPTVSPTGASNFSIYEASSINGRLKDVEDKVPNIDTNTKNIKALTNRATVDEIAFEQGAIGTNGNEQVNTKRIRSKNYLYGGYKVTLPSEFKIYLAAYYDVTDGSFVEYKQPLLPEYIILSTLTKDGVEHTVKARIVVARTTDTDNITVEDIKKSFALEELYDKSKNLDNRVAANETKLSETADIVKNEQICETAGTATANAPCVMLAGKTYKITNISDSLNYFAVYARETATSTNITISLGLGWKVSVMFTPEVNCNFIRMSAGYEGTPCKVSVEETSTHDYRIKELESGLAATNTDIEIHKSQLPTVQFDFSHDIIDNDGEADVFGLTPNVSYYPNYLSQLYAKFDALVAAYPDYVSRVDLAEELNIPYPAYASEYRTYMYIFKPTNEAINTTTTKLKKALLVGGEHSGERTSSIALYYIAKGLCECPNDDYFKLRNSFEIHIIPMLEGYGCIHCGQDPLPAGASPNIGRTNYNGVNINRNYPTPDWHVSGTPGDADYSGASAGSEFETQLVLGIVDQEHYDMVGDYHSHVETMHVAYSELAETPNTDNDSKSRTMYSACADISITFKKAYPQYYGVGGDLLPMGPGPNNYANTNGVQYYCMANRGVKLAYLCECPYVIAWTNGQHAGNWAQYFTDVIFNLNEYLFRAQLLRFADWVLRYVKNVN